jgi:hypothetical protein
LRRVEDIKLKSFMVRNPKERRPRQRPRQKWWRHVKGDLDRLGATEEDAKDRDRWRGFVGAAKYLLRYVWPWKKE